STPANSTSARSSQQRNSNRELPNANLKMHDIDEKQPNNQATFANLNPMDEDVYFPTVADLRRWFESNHDQLAEAWFGFYKVGTGVPSITYKDAVDECLCFGWIDGVRYTVDEQRWRERFTPRRAGSFWSSVNTKRALELIDEGRMTPAGITAFEARD